MAVLELSLGCFRIEVSNFESTGNGWQAVALICGIDPRKIRVERALGGNEPIGFSFYAPKEMQDLFYSMLEIAKNHICDFQPQQRASFIRIGIEHRYQIQVPLIAFVNWAQPIIEGKGHKVPAWLVELRPKENQEDICGTKEQNTNAKLLKLLFELANLNLQEPYKTAEVLASETKKRGYPVSKSTIVTKINQSLAIKPKFSDS